MESLGPVYRGGGGIPKEAQNSILRCVIVHIRLFLPLCHACTAHLMGAVALASCYVMMQMLHVYILNA